MTPTYPRRADSELRAARTAEFRAAYGRLAEVEEAEYKAAKAAELA